MKKLFLGIAAAAFIALPASAQRRMDRLDRGLVAVKTDAGVFASWRVFGEDADAVRFNLYRDGSLVNQTPLSVSNFTDPAGSSSSKYVVKTVVNGVETESSKETQTLASDYIEIKMAPMPSADYEPNDATIADLDGDGEMEVIIKLRSLADIRNSYPYDATEFDVIHAYKLDGTLLWWISAGPNMVDFQSNELNIAAYDWDGDGRAECVLRGGDGMVIHQADGSEYVVGDPTQNTRNQLGQGGGGHFTRVGNEYLIYMDGLSAKPFSVTDYPLPRFENGETDLAAAWGDGYGHRSNKHFFGAPYLDGRNPSIFLARGIYTRHKMIAYDVDPATHQLKERWRWNCNTPGSPWYGQGYHNYTVADVDWDGRDEIVFGSMVIDDNGLGLSSTGLGHGDSHHVGDFNPYIYRAEIVACNEDNPNNNYRDATTSKIYYRTIGGNDDGRAIAGNFTNDFPGAAFITSRDSQSLISCVTNNHISNATSTGDVAQNFRIFWDGDLLDETFNYENGKNTPGAIYKYGKGRIHTFADTKTNNDTKGTPCMQADIFGDWREEVILRTADNSAIRIYTTTIATEHRIYTLLHDPQYRNAMVWQMNGYNQTPHVSYFLGELEGITQAPPCPTINGSVEVNGSIDGNGKRLVFATVGNASAAIADGASPDIFIDNTPSWVQGTGNNDNIKYEYYTHTLTGGGFAGDMKLVKLGGGTLILPDAAQKHKGDTEIWDGTLSFNGEMTASHVRINRFGVLSTDGGKFSMGIESDYGSQIIVGSPEKASSLHTSYLDLGFGAKILIDLFADGSADVINADSIGIEKKSWLNGPEYSAPVIVFSRNAADGIIPAGEYLIGNIGKIAGNISDLTIEGLNGLKANLNYTDGKLTLRVAETREATDVVWTGAETASWDTSDAENFTIEATGEATYFVAGDRVIFDDNASATSITIPEGIYPSKVTFNNNKKNFTISGAGFEGNCDIEKKGTGKATLKNVSGFTGSIEINNGILETGALGANEGASTGALGQYKNKITLKNGGILALTAGGKSSHPINAVNGGIRVTGSAVTITGGNISGNGVLVKSGSGQLNLATSCAIDTLKIEAGKVYDEGDTHSVGKNVVFNGNKVELIHNNSVGSYSTDNANYIVPKGKSGKLTLDGRCAYKGKLTGQGALEVYAPWIRNTLEGDWSEFEGTLTATQNTGSTVNGYGSSFDFNSSKGLPKAKLSVSAGTTFNTDKSEVRIGSLAGAGVLGNQSKKFIINGRNENTEFTGTFGTSVSIEKNGADKLTLTKDNSGMGIVSLNEGTIELKPEANTNSKSMLGARAMTVKGVLTGCGRLNNSTVTFTDGAELTPVNPNKSLSYFSLDFNNNVVMQPGSTLLCKFYDAKRYGKITVGGNLDLQGEVKVTLNGYTPKLDDEFILWTAASAGSTPRLELPELPEGLHWLISGVTPTEGRIKITNADAVIEIEGDMMADCHLYSLGGNLIKSFTSTVGEAMKTVRSLDHGIYILRYSTAGISRSVKISN